MKVKRADVPKPIEDRFSRDVIEVFKEVYNEEWYKALESLVKPPLRYFLRVNTMKSEPEKVIRKLKELGYEFQQHELIPEAIYTLVVPVNHLPEYSKIVVADRFAAESVMLGANLYAPGVKSAHDVKRRDIVGIVDETGLLVGVGIAVMDEATLRKAKKGIAVKVTHPLYKLPSMEDLEIIGGKGILYPQSLPSILTSRIVDPKPNEIIIDMCAAPGGKLTHMAALANDKAIILGFDRSKRKIEALKELITLMGFKNIKLGIMDTRYIDLYMPHLKADKVLLDPPCSALGVRPKFSASITKRDILNYYKYQVQFLKSASKILRKGGTLIYSVCTITKEEVEAIFEFAINNLNLEPLEQEIFIADTGLKPYDINAIQRFAPHKHDTPGFSIIKMIKV